MNKYDNEPVHINWLSVVGMILAIIGLVLLGLAIAAKAASTEPEPVKVSVVTQPVVTTEETEPEVEETIEETVIETETIVSEPLSEPTIEETVPVIDEWDLECLAVVIFQEAGGDECCDDCRRRVADVVLNRVEHPTRFRDTIEGVLTTPNQYGTLYKTGIKWPARAGAPGEKHAVDRAYRIAREVLEGQHSELYGNGYIWQAEFIQGSGGFWCCGTYFGRE
jgi:hypothetical protein